MKLSRLILLFVAGVALAQRPDSTTLGPRNPTGQGTSVNRRIQHTNEDSAAHPGVLSQLPSQAQHPGIDESELPKGAKDTTTLTFKDTDVRDIFRAISYQHGLNLFVDNAIARRTTIALTKVRVYDAIRFLCEQNSLDLALQGGIFRITPPPPAVPPPPPAPRVPIVGFENGLLSVVLKDDDLEKVILEIQHKSGKNILIISGTTGSVTGKLMDIEFDLGFTQLMNNNGFAVQKKNGIYVISRLEYYVGTQGSATPQKSGPYWVSVKDSLVTIDVTNAPVERVLTDMIRQLNTDLVMYNQLTGTVTARATAMPLAKALDMILRNTAYTYRESEGVYFVGEKTNKALVMTKLIRLNYLRAEQTLEMIPQSITSQASLKVMKEHNALLAVASNDILQQLHEVLVQLDKPVPQVLIEAVVVDYDITRGREFGIDAGLLGPGDTTHFTRKGMLWPGIDMTFGGKSVNRMLEKAKKVKIFGTEIDLARLGVLPDDFYLRLRALEKEGLANVKSRPVIATLNGYKATLSIGTTQYYLLKTTIPYRDNNNQTVFQETQSFQTIQADVKLEITPYVGADGYVTLDIKPDFKTPIGQFSSEIPPTINSRSLSSTVVVKEGETIVLGGLIQEGESEVSTKVPILGSIPLLGKLFSSTETTTRKSELLIYVTPYISYGEAFQNAYRYEDDK